MSCGVGHRRGSDPALLWLWHRPMATAPIGPLDWEPPYAMGVPQGKKKKKRKKKKGFRVRMALLTPYFRASGVQSYERINFCCFKPPG